MENKVERVIETFSFDLSRDEAFERHKKAIQLKQDLSKAEGEALLAKRTWKEKIEDLQRQIAMLEAAALYEKEEREVRCTKIIDYAEEKVSYRHYGKIIFTRPINEAERQLDMFKPIPEPTKEKASDRTCTMCDQPYYGTGKICHNCKKTEPYRFAEEG